MGRFARERRQLQSEKENTAAAKGESWPTAAIPMENPYCSCKLTRAAAKVAVESKLQDFMLKVEQQKVALAEAEAARDGLAAAAEKAPPATLRAASVPSAASLHPAAAAAPTFDRRSISGRREGASELTAFVGTSWAQASSEKDALRSRIAEFEGQVRRCLCPVLPLLSCIRQRRFLRTPRHSPRPRT